MATSATVAPVTNQTWSYLSGTWTNISNVSTPAPFAVDFPNLVYDAADEYVVLYDEVGILSTNGSETIQTTWSFESGLWKDLTASAGTPPAFFGGMAYDAADRYVVYFGGETLADELTNATFTFVAGAWTNATAAVSGALSGRIDYGITYDDATGQVLLYGGLDQLYAASWSAWSTETWAYSSGNWTLLPANSTSYNTQSMAYDPALNETLLLGSSNSSVAPLNVVTWILSNGVWAIGAPAIAPSVPVADAGHLVTLTVTTSPNAGALAYRYGGLPPGCVSADSPVLACVPTAAGTYVISVSVTGAGGFSATAATTIVVNLPPEVLQFASTIPVGEVGVPIGFGVTAGSGSGGLTYFYDGLPTGCSTEDSAQLQCTPSVSGTYSVTANVTDGVGVSAASTIQVTVVSALSVTTFALDKAVIDTGGARDALDRGRGRGRPALVRLLRPAGRMHEPGHRVHDLSADRGRSVLDRGRSQRCPGRPGGGHDGAERQSRPGYRGLDILQPEHRCGGLPQHLDLRGRRYGTVRVPVHGTSERLYRPGDRRGRLHLRPRRELLSGRLGHRHDGSYRHGPGRVHIPSRGPEGHRTAWALRDAGRARVLVGFCGRRSGDRNRRDRRWLPMGTCPTGPGDRNRAAGRPRSGRDSVDRVLGGPDPPRGTATLAEGAKEACRTEARSRPGGWGPLGEGRAP